ncbi:MAG: glutamate formimidoyltransferase [Bryobacteraceae bacterium]
MTVVECVPNFSEGRDPVIVAAIGRGVPCLLDTTSDPDHNRSVLTFAGAPREVADAALAAVRVAVEKIDIRRHAGVHPRLGAADVVPFIPVREIGLAQCADLARDTGARIWEQLRVPVYLYEAAAERPACRRLENVRRLAPAGLPPDIGEGRHATAGACVVGARKFLVAWNINLRTTDVAAARTIAREIRESNGGLPAVKAMGFPLEARGQVQVSINLVDFEVTPLYVVFEAVAERCLGRGIEVAGSELIGMIPAAAIKASEGHNLRWENLRPELILENRLPALQTKGVALPATPSSA